mmetsp:Transcript_7341/g.10852  ORF Transcript_7341/g.10852 Transcript_7341/m.10852 type:complete len:82 (-) Transcript_7341:736-981(-)
MINISFDQIMSSTLIHFLYESYLFFRILLWSAAEIFLSSRSPPTQAHMRVQMVPSQLMDMAIFQTAVIMFLVRHAKLNFAT